MFSFAPVIALLLAAIPVLHWYAARLQDGGGEILGLIPLLLAAYFALRDRKTISPSRPGRITGIAFLILYTIGCPFLPALLRAVLFIIAATFLTGVARKPGIACLILLALPWQASLDFFFGYPLRLITSVSAEILLNMIGLEVSRQGVQLLHAGNIVGVDPACSGLNLLWTSGLFTALLATLFHLPWKKLPLLAAAALALSLAANSLRATLLFFPESGLITMPHILHPVIGLVTAAIAFLILIRLARVLAGKIKIAPRSNASQKFQIFLTVTALAATVSPLLSLTEISTIHPSQQPLSHYEGQPLTPIALNPAEEKFYGDFPGSVAIYEGSSFKLIVRTVTRATRMLHPASHCLRAEGFDIGGKTRVTLSDGSRWLTYTATRNGKTWQIRERITDASGDKQWTEISAWYWQAFFKPRHAPWEAMTVMEPLD
ncbi:MAG: exosortase/archaeosortase family protein [Luteolibacter sp.]